MDKGSNRRVFLHEIKNFRVQQMCFLKLRVAIAIDLAISNSMLGFVSRFWLNRVNSGGYL